MARERLLPGASSAHGHVRRAVKRGDLQSPTILTCADCGGGASEYDHRDYGRPLFVEPVCHACNVQRGPAIPAGVGGTYTHGYAHGYVVTLDRVRAASFAVVDFGAYDAA